MKRFILILAITWLPISMSAAAEEKPLQLASLGSLSASNATPLLQASFALRQLDRRLLLQPTDHEAVLIKALIKYRSGDYTAAMQTLDALIKQAPDFHLAHLMKGDMLLSRVRHISALGNNAVLSSLLAKQDEQKLENLRAEARMRLKGVALSTFKGRLPRQVLALGNNVPSAILVDKSSHRLYVYQRHGNGKLALSRDYYVSTGKLTGNKESSGDLRTPEGVYFVTAWIPKEKLPDKYGVGAFPVNYPNELDQRLGKTGHGIWLHGTQSHFYSRPPRDSEGCVVLTNSDLNDLRATVTPGLTPVVIAAKVDWVDVAHWQRQRDELLAALESWRRDWQSLDVERYLAHYASDFWSRGYNLRSWQQRKRNVFRAKTYQRIKLSDISLLAYAKGTQASDGDIVVARFQQHYHSNNFNSEMSKRLYLQRRAGHWKIVYEGR